MSTRFKDERGLTLPELLITIMLLSILMTLVVAGFVSFSRTLTDQRMAADNTSAASIAMNETTRVIRSGTLHPVTGQVEPDPVFAAIGRREVVLYSYLDTDASDPRPVKVRFWVNDRRELEETRTVGVPVSGQRGVFTYTGASTSRVIARRIVFNGSAPVFTYLDKNGAAVTVPTSGTLKADTIARKETIRSIAAVQVRFTVQTDDRGQATPATLQNTVGIPNLGVSRVEAG